MIYLLIQMYNFQKNNIWLILIPIYLSLFYM